MSWIAVGVAAVGATTSYLGARQKNAAVRSSMNSANRAAAITLRQQSLAIAVEKQKQIDESQRIIGRLRVAAGTAGVSNYGAGERAATLDAGENLALIAANLATGQAATKSQLEAQQASLKSQQTNALFAAIQGGVQGFMAGQSLSGAFGGGAAAGPTATTGMAGTDPGLSTFGQPTIPGSVPSQNPSFVV